MKINKILNISLTDIRKRNTKTHLKEFQLLNRLHSSLHPQSPEGCFKPSNQIWSLTFLYNLHLPLPGKMWVHYTECN